MGYQSFVFLFQFEVFSVDFPIELGNGRILAGGLISMIIC